MLSSFAERGKRNQVDDLLLGTDLEKRIPGLRKFLNVAKDALVRGEGYTSYEAEEMAEAFIRAQLRNSNPTADDARKAIYFGRLVLSIKLLGPTQKPGGSKDG